MIARRLVVFGSLVTLTGCATRSLDECDPHTGGPFDYLACQDQYKRRHENKVAQLLDDENRYRDALGEKDRLESALSSLQAELNAANTRIARLRATREALERQVSNAQGNAQALEALVVNVKELIASIEQANLVVINYQPPPLPLTPAVYSAWRSLTQNRQDAAKANEWLHADWDRIAKAWMEFGAHFVQGQVIEAVAEKILRDAALDEVAPYVGFAVTLHDFWSAGEAIYETYEATVGRH